MSYNNRPPYQQGNNYYQQQQSQGYPGYNTGYVPPSNYGQPQQPQSQQGYGQGGYGHNTTSGYPGYGQQQPPPVYANGYAPQQNYGAPQQAPGYSQPPYGAPGRGPTSGPSPGPGPSYNTSTSGYGAPTPASHGPGAPPSSVVVRRLSTYHETLSAVESLSFSPVYHQARSASILVAQTLWDHASLAATWKAVQSPATRGHLENIIVLIGVLGIEFNKNTYNIPVQIHLPRGFPTEAPYCLVTPTENMRVSPNNSYVEAPSGRVKIAFLDQWSSSCSLSEVCNLMKSAFSVAPPVYAVAPGTTAASSATSNSSTGSAQSSGSYGQHPKHPQYPQQHQHQPSTQQQSQHQTQHQPQYSQANTGYGYQPTPVVTPDPAEAERERRKNLLASLEVKTNFALKNLAEDASKTIKDTVFAREQVAHSKAELGATLRAKKQLLVEVQGTSEKLTLQATQLSSWLTENESRELDVETAVAFENPISEQLLQSVAEDNAVDETISEFTRMALEGHVGLAEFVKETRRLARQQFMARALSHKIERML